MSGSDDISAFEEEYCNNIKDCKLYYDEFLKDKKFSLEDCINSKLPIFISANKVIDEDTLIEVYRVKFYNHTGIECKFDFNMELAIDMKAMWGFDTEAELNSLLRFQLEGAK